MSERDLAEFQNDEWQAQEEDERRLFLENVVYANMGNEKVLRRLGVHYSIEVEKGKGVSENVTV